MTCEFPAKGHRGLVERYRIEYPDGYVSTALCRRHAQPLRMFCKQLGKEPQERQKIDRKAATRPVDLDLL